MSSFFFGSFPLQECVFNFLSLLYKRIPPQIAPLLEQCWAGNAKKRPSFEKICEKLVQLQSDPKLIFRPNNNSRHIPIRTATPPKSPIESPPTEEAPQAPVEIDHPPPVSQPSSYQQTGNYFPLFSFYTFFLFNTIPLKIKSNRTSPSQRLGKSC